MELIDIVMKLAGAIDPIGDTNTDEKRFQNLQKVTDLVEVLLVKVAHVAGNRARQEYSMNRAGEHASAFLSRTGKWLSESEE